MLKLKKTTTEPERDKMELGRPVTRALLQI
jgi:hypothetical protein